MTVPRPDLDQHRRRPRRRAGSLAALALTVGAVGAVAVVSPAAPAAYAGSGEPAASSSATSYAASGAAVLPDADEALEAATEALRGPTTDPVAPPKAVAPETPGTPETPGAPDERVDATLALRDLAAARPTMAGGDAVLADSLLARPGDGARDPYGDGYTVRSSKICSAHFCVHRVASTPDRATATFARTTLRTMEAVYRTEVKRLGFRRPPTDGTAGGNKKFDVYLKELGRRSVYGYCAPERVAAGRPGRAATAFCVLDNDFARSQFGRAPLGSLRVTAGHEFFHAVQFGYDRLEDRWLLETTATWMEERFADDVDDNRRYLRSGQVARPASSLDVFVNGGFNQYGNWAFWESLSQRYGNSIVKEVWQRASRSGVTSVEALSQALRRRGGLPQVFASYAAGNNVPGRSYAEGGQKGWPRAAVSATRTISRGTTQVTWGGSVDHLASRNLRVLSKGVPAGRRIRVSVDGPAAETSPAAALVVVRKNGSVLRKAVALDAQGRGSVTAGFASGRWSRAYVTVANASTRYDCDRGTSFSCEGDPLDQAQRFVVKVDQLR